MVREALEYIRRNYLNETVIKIADRAEAMRVSNFPCEAVEEALVNAVYHRGYDTREPVEVRIKMLRAMRQNGSPPPQFDFDEDHSYFQVRLPVQPATRNADTVIDDRHVPEQVTEQVTEQVQRLT